MSGWMHVGFTAAVGHRENLRLCSIAAPSTIKLLVVTSFGHLARMEIELLLVLKNGRIAIDQGAVSTDIIAALA